MIQYIALVIVAACGTIKTENSAETSPVIPNDAGSVDDIPSTDSTHTDTDADTPPEIAVAVAPPDSFVDVTPDVAPTPTDCAALFPLKGQVKLFATAPCGAGASITDLDDSSLGICTDFQKNHMLFQLDDGKITQSRTLDFVPDQVDGTPTGNIAITATDSKSFTNGVLRLYGVKAEPSWLPFTPVTVDQQKFTPSFGKGIQFASASFFVATGNIDFSKVPAAYSPGSLLAYPTGAITFNPLATKGLNATSVGTWTDASGTHVAVVNTGPLDEKGQATSAKSRLAVFNAETSALEQVFDLPFGGLGLAGEISIAGGRMAIPSADNSRRVVILNTADLKATPQVVTAPDATPPKPLHLMAFARIWGPHLVAGDTNTGLVSVWDMDKTPPAPVGGAITVDKTLTPYQGIADAACIGGKLLVTVGTNIMEIQ